MSSKLFAFYDPDFDIYDENTRVSRPIVGYIDLSDGKFFTYAAERKKAVSHEFIKKLEINSVEDLEKEDKFYTIFRFELDNSNTNQKLCNIIGSKMVGKKSLNSAVMYQDDDGAWIKAYITKINNDKTYDITYRKDRKQFKITNVPLGNRLTKPFMKVGTPVKFINDENKKGVVTYGSTRRHAVMLVENGKKVGEVTADIDTITYDDGHQPILRATKNMKEFKEKIKNRQKCLKINKDKCEKRLKDEYTEKCAIKNEEECRKTEYCNYNSRYLSKFFSGSCSLDNKKIKKHIEKEVSNCREYDECFNLDGLDTRYLRPLIPQYFPEESNRAPMCLKKTPKPFLDMDQLSLDNIQKMFNLEPVETLKENYDNIYNLNTEISEEERQKMNKDYNKDYKKIEKGQIKLMNYIKSQKWTENDFEYYTTMYGLINRMLNDKIQETTVENFTDEAMKYVETQEDSAKEFNNLSEEGKNNLRENVYELINNAFTESVDNVNQADIIDDNTVIMTENVNQKGGVDGFELLYEEDDEEDNEEDKKVKLDKRILEQVLKMELLDLQKDFKELEEEHGINDVNSEYHKLPTDKKREINNKLSYLRSQINLKKEELKKINAPQPSIWKNIKSYGEKILDNLKKVINYLIQFFTIKNFKIFWKIIKFIHNNHWVVLVFLAILKILRKSMCRYISQYLYGEVLKVPEHMGSSRLESIGSLLDTMSDNNLYGHLQIIFLDMINSNHIWNNVLIPAWDKMSSLFTEGLNLIGYLLAPISIFSVIGSKFISGIGSTISTLAQEIGIPIIRSCFTLYINWLFTNKTLQELKGLVTDTCLDPNIKTYVKTNMTPSQEREFYKKHKNDNWSFWYSNFANTWDWNSFFSNDEDYDQIKRFTKNKWYIKNKDKLEPVNGKNYLNVLDDQINRYEKENNDLLKRWKYLDFEKADRSDLKEIFEKAEKEVEKEEMEKYVAWKDRNSALVAVDSTISNTSLADTITYMSDFLYSLFVANEFKEILTLPNSDEILELPMVNSTSNTFNTSTTYNTSNTSNISNISNK